MTKNTLLIGTTFQGVLGAVIGSLRSAKDITQADVAEEVGINVSTWSRIERGESALTVEQLVLAAIRLEVPLSVLFEDVEKEIADLRRQGVEVAISRDCLEEKKFVPLSNSQLKAAGVGAMAATIGLAAAAPIAIMASPVLVAGAAAATAIAAYRGLLRRKSN
jgi:transcriptional regulator with XRE-family HTH domain